MDKKVLGRGLEALIPQDATQAKEKVLHLKTEHVHASRFQPRLVFSQEKIEELELRLSEILNTQDQNVRGLLVQALIDHARDQKQQYSACATAHIAKRKEQGHLPNGLN